MPKPRRFRMENHRKPKPEEEPDLNHEEFERKTVESDAKRGSDALLERLHDEARKR